MQKMILYNGDLVTLIDGTTFDIKDLYQYYIVENHSQKESLVKFNIKPGAFTKVVNHYGIKKPRQLSQVHNKKTCLERYGDPTYNNQEQLRKTNLKKYGCENVFQAAEIKERLTNTKVKRYGNANFVNPEKAQQTCLKKYGVAFPSQLDSVKEQKRKTCFKHYGVEYPMQSEEVKAKYDFIAAGEKGFETKKRNGTTNTSAIQMELTEILINKYGKDDVFPEYKETRYPYHCDIYIKSLDLFIELNLYFTHGYHPFTGSPEDLELLDTWKVKAVNSNFYANAIHVWTVSDPEKQECAKRNKLNYKMFYTMQEINDFIESLK